MKNLIIFLLSVIVLMQSGSVFSQYDPERQWPSYRGYRSAGVLDRANLPQDFNISTMKNIRWKIEIPGLGLSSPVIWEDRLFITTAIGKSGESGLKPGIFGDVTSVNDSSVHEWKVICYDKNSGKLLWERTSHTGVPAIKRHPKSTHANTSVATDGKYVVAFFGSEGLYCYDMKGNLKWEKNFGILKSVWSVMPSAQWEFASSPVIFRDKLIVLCDVLENPFIAAFDVASGKELWKANRDDLPGWSTPNIYMNGDRAIVVVNGFRHMGGYDLESGKEVWRMSGGGDIPVPTPVVGKNLIYLNSAHGPLSPIFAVSYDAVGDITLKDDSLSGKFIKWRKLRGASYLLTLLLYNNHLYNISWNGNVSCLDPNTGFEIFKGKLGRTRSFVASAVASDGRIYVVDEEGTVYIMKDGTDFSLLAEIPLGDKCLTAPSITDGMIFFRTQKWIIAAGIN